MRCLDVIWDLQPSDNETRNLECRTEIDLVKSILGSRRNTAKNGRKGFGMKIERRKEKKINKRERKQNPHWKFWKIHHSKTK